MANFGITGGGKQTEAFEPTMRLAELEWSVTGYTFWNKKRDFILQSDTYPTWCLFAIESGSFAYEIGESHGTAGSGSLVLCPPNVPFRRRTAASPMTFHFVLLRWNEPHPDNISEDGSAPRLPVTFTPADSHRLFDTFGKWRRLNALSGFKRLSLISHYWNDIWKTWCLEHIEGDGPDVPRSADKLMNRAARRLEERCSEPYGVKELAGELGLSPVQLIRRFRAAYNMTPGDYLTGLRMKQACRLLCETRMTIEQIASACGYASGYYLSRLFAARMSVTPSEYRRRNRV
ncbi:helix-turn-helix domain-containing protein [Paenibacillus ginsengarvi]|uniref:AraC family transcriptional regulator n=1 Tax=Paenibacillus ginsengarvi TaxID=400777 RepID=A0A3B0C860_9BACL|nr:AraC family transcriptional regulator [Paenibacillus ginsengarvi]RKN82153.1 AraC family transcriptional regulator [Paenibacillus ginsengarvi]